MATPDDLSPEYRAIYESFRRLGLSEREALTAATCRPADRPGHGPLSHPSTMAENAAMWAEPGHVVTEAFGALGASVVGRDGRSEAPALREAAVRSFGEALGVASDGGEMLEEGAGHAIYGVRVPALPVSVVALLDESARTFAGELDENARAHVAYMFDRRRPASSTADQDRRVLEGELAAEAARQSARTAPGARRFEVSETSGRMSIREVNGR